MEFKDTSRAADSPDDRGTDSIEFLETESLHRAAKTDDPDLRLKWLQNAAALLDRRKVKGEIANSHLAAVNARAELHSARSKFIATTVIPMSAVFMTLIALVVQSVQNQRSNEDTKWQESMKAVSFKDSKSALTGALSMQSFFGTRRYGQESRAIASALLPLVDDVNAFDEILQSMTARTTLEDQFQIVSVGKALVMSSRNRYGFEDSSWPNSASVPPFLIYSVTAIDFNPDSTSATSDVRDKVAAWEIDSVSQALSKLWVQRKIAPASLLAYIALEDGSFKGLNFSNGDLTGSVLYDADFDGSSFQGATLTNTTLRHITVAGADFSNISPSNFVGSTWTDTKWWEATRISSELCTKLETEYRPDAWPSKLPDGCPQPPHHN